MARIAIVKPEKARAIEDMVIQMAQRGQLAAKIDEDKLIDLLNQVGVTEEKQRTKVTVRGMKNSTLKWSVDSVLILHVLAFYCRVAHLQMKRRTYFSDEEDDDDDDDF